MHNFKFPNRTTVSAYEYTCFSVLSVSFLCLLLNYELYVYHHRLPGLLDTTTWYQAMSINYYYLFLENKISVCIWDIYILYFVWRQCYIYEPMYFIHSLIYDDHNIIDSEALEQGVQHWKFVSFCFDQN